MPKCVAVYSGILESKTNKLQFNNPINIMITVILGVFALAYGLFTLYLGTVVKCPIITQRID